MLNDVYLKGTCLKILKAFMFHINIKMSLGSVKEFQGCHTLREFREFSSWRKSQGDSGNLREFWFIF